MQKEVDAMVLVEDLQQALSELEPENNGYRNDVQFIKKLKSILKRLLPDESNHFKITKID